MPRGTVQYRENPDGTKWYAGRRSCLGGNFDGTHWIWGSKTRAVFEEWLGWEGARALKKRPFGQGSAGREGGTLSKVVLEGPQHPSNITEGASFCVTYGCFYRSCPRARVTESKAGYLPFE